jgi:formylglycine-generating enzyme
VENPHYYSDLHSTILKQLGLDHQKMKFRAHGNVWELCRDWYHTQLPGGVDPDLWSVKGTMNRDGTHSRVRRGGAFVEDGWTCRSACRLRYEPERRSDHIGFRVVAVQP